MYTVLCNMQLMGPVLVANNEKHNNNYEEIWLFPWF